MNLLEGVVSILLLVCVALKYIDLGQPKSVAPSGQVAEKPIKLTQEKVKFRFRFCNFAMRFSVLNFINIKQSSNKKNICGEEKVII